MIIKYTKSISLYRYILAFDLAKHISGYSLLDIKENKLVTVGTIDTNRSSSELIWSYFYDEVTNVIQFCKNKVGPNILITKEKLPNQNGRFSTIDTLQGLAQAHSIFDLAAYNSGIDVYDYDGVHAISVKSYFKTLTNIDKPQKEDISNYIQNQYPDIDLSEYTLDVTDSVAVALTLYNKKYNADITEKIKEYKKKIKTLKMQHAKDKIQEQINALEKIKI